MEYDRWDIHIGNWAELIKDIAAQVRCGKGELVCDVDIDVILNHPSPL